MLPVKSMWNQFWFVDYVQDGVCVFLSPRREYYKLINFWHIFKKFLKTWTLADIIPHSFQILFISKICIEREVMRYMTIGTCMNQCFVEVEDKCLLTQVSLSLFYQVWNFHVIWPIAILQIKVFIILLFLTHQSHQWYLFPNFLAVHVSQTLHVNDLYLLLIDLIHNL